MAGILPAIFSLWTAIFIDEKARNPIAVSEGGRYSGDNNKGDDAMKMISDNFEMRYVSRDPRADGETDFKGDTSTLTTQQRIDYLNACAREILHHAENFSLDEQVVSLEEARERLHKLKPQPVPMIRRRIPLEEWKWIGRRDKEDRRHISGTGQAAIARQDWRCFLEWKLKENAAYDSCKFSLGTVAVVDLLKKNILIT